MIFNPLITASWPLKKICRIKDKLREWILKDKYSIKEVYLNNFKDNPKVPWSRLVWNRASSPKSKFILWMIALNKLKTKSKLTQMKILADDQCPLCFSVTETIEHLFFLCPFSVRCIQELSRWLTLTRLPFTFGRMINFNWRTIGLHRKMIISSICTLCYYIWKTRNKVIWLSCMSTVDKIIVQVKSEIKTRFFIYTLLNLKHSLGIEILLLLY